MNQDAHLLIVDDEQAIASMLDDYFRMEGFRTTVVGSGADAIEAAEDSERGRLPRIDLVLLDVNMPGMDGFEACRLIRKRLTCPIIFLTARVEDADQLDGFASGGDDYVLKPFSLQVLGSRVRAHLTRELRRGEDRSAHVWFGDCIAIDYARRTVEVSGVRESEQDRAKEPVRLDLTRTEFDIAALLSKKPGRVYDRTFIYEQVWGWNAEGDPAIVREHIRRIRKKFAEAGCGVDPIETVWGVGYRWSVR